MTPNRKWKIGKTRSSRAKMLNRTEHLTPKRRVALAWVLIFGALLCQVTPHSSLLNFFALLAAAAFHEMLIQRARPPWEPKLIRWVCLGFCLILAPVIFLRIIPTRSVTYLLYPLIAFLLAWALVADIRWLLRYEQSQSRDAAQRESDRTEGR